MKVVKVTVDIEHKGIAKKLNGLYDFLRVTPRKFFEFSIA